MHRNLGVKASVQVYCRRELSKFLKHRVGHEHALFRNCEKLVLNVLQILEGGICSV